MRTAALYGLIAVLAQHGAPSSTSGMLLESPELPEGTLTVRIAKGGMPETIVGAEIVVEYGSERQTARTDGKGRARFDGLPPGATVVASLGEVRSQPVTIPSGVGARMLLLVPAEPGQGQPAGAQADPSDEAPAEPRPEDPHSAMPPGMPDLNSMSGIPLPSPDLPTGTLMVRVAKSSLREILADAEVVVQSEGKRYVGTTDAGGRVTIEGLPPGTEAIASVGETRTPPFTVPDSGGARMLLFVGGKAPAADPHGAAGMPHSPHGQAVGKPGGGLVMSPQTHIVAEIADDDLQILEVLHLTNEGPPRAAGTLVIPLPEEATDVAVDPELEGDFRPQDGNVVWTGPLPTGTRELRLSFRLPIDDGDVILRQPAPLPWRGYGVIARDIEGMKVSGPGLGPQEERPLDAQSFITARGNAIPAGGMLEIRFTGLPFVDSTGRNVAVALTFLLIGWALYASLRVPASGKGSGLAARRAHLMGELVALERRRRAGETTADHHRARLVSEIESLDRTLSESGA